MSEDNRPHPDEVIKAMSDAAEKMGYGLLYAKIGWFTSSDIAPMFIDVEYEVSRK